MMTVQHATLQVTCLAHFTTELQLFFNFSWHVCVVFGHLVPCTHLQRITMLCSVVSKYTISVFFDLS